MARMIEVFKVTIQFEVASGYLWRAYSMSNHLHKPKRLPYFGPRVLKSMALSAILGTRLTEPERTSEATARFD